LNKSIDTIIAFLLNLSAATPAKGLRIIIGISPKAKVHAKLNPDPVIFKTYNPMAKVYMEVPNKETSFPAEKRIRLLISLVLLVFAANKRDITMICCPPGLKSLTA
jgi:hypothetical protein